MSDFNWHNEAERQWDKRADSWNQSSQNMWDSGSRSTILPFFQKYVPSGASVLDVGCGDGYATYKLSRAGYIACGTDLSERMIEMAKERGETKGLSFVRADLARLPFETESFDAVMAINSLEWTEQPLEAWREVSRVLKPGGYACVAILGPTAMPRINSYRRLYGESVICNTMMPWEFKQLVTENGFIPLDGQGVYKREVKEQHLHGLPEELKQSLAFLWTFMLKKK